jgi:hypothetical protein
MDVGVPVATGARASAELAPTVTKAAVIRREFRIDAHPRISFATLCRAMAKAQEAAVAKLIQSMDNSLGAVP